MRFLSAIFTVLLLLPATGRAQTAMTSTDVQRLQEELTTVENELSRVRSSNPDLASRLNTEYEDLRDEVTYLKVKLRKEGTVPRTEYHATRDRIDTLLGKVRGSATTSTSTTT